MPKLGYNQREFCMLVDGKWLNYEGTPQDTFTPDSEWDLFNEYISPLIVITEVGFLIVQMEDYYWPSETYTVHFSLNADPIRSPIVGFATFLFMDEPQITPEEGEIWFDYISQVVPYTTLYFNLDDPLYPLKYRATTGEMYNTLTGQLVPDRLPEGDRYQIEGEVFYNYFLFGPISRILLTNAKQYRYQAAGREIEGRFSTIAPIFPPYSLVPTHNHLILMTDRRNRPFEHILRKINTLTQFAQEANKPHVYALGTRIYQEEPYLPESYRVNIDEILNCLVYITDTDRVVSLVEGQEYDSNDNRYGKIIRVYPIVNYDDYHLRTIQAKMKEGSSDQDLRVTTGLPTDSVLKQLISVLYGLPGNRIDSMDPDLFERIKEIVNWSRVGALKPYAGPPGTSSSIVAILDSYTKIG